MIEPEQIPDEVIAAFLSHHNDEGIEYTWRECIAAAINHWPGMRYSPAIEDEVNPAWKNIFPATVTLPIIEDTADD